VKPPPEGQAHEAKALRRICPDVEQEAEVQPEESLHVPPVPPPNGARHLPRTGAHLGVAVSHTQLTTLVGSPVPSADDPVGHAAMLSVAEHATEIPPLAPIQFQLHGPAPASATGEAVPALQRPAAFAEIALAKVPPSAPPQSPSSAIVAPQVTPFQIWPTTVHLQTGGAAAPPAPVFEVPGGQTIYGWHVGTPPEKTIKWSAGQLRQSVGIFGPTSTEPTGQPAAVAQLVPFQVPPKSAQ
jgi:hypothetical protein